MFFLGVFFTQIDDGSVLNKTRSGFDMKIRQFGGAFFSSTAMKEERGKDGKPKRKYGMVRVATPSTVGQQSGREVFAMAKNKKQSGEGGSAIARTLNSGTLGLYHFLYVEVQSFTWSCTLGSM